MARRNAEQDIDVDETDLIDDVDIEDEGEDVVDDEPEQPVHEEPSPEMTVQQLRDAIEAANGFAPRKATKAELIAILETL